MPRNLKHIKRVKAKGKEYIYFKTGQFDADGNEILKRLPGLREDGFGEAYGSACATRTKRANAKAVLTVVALSDMYEISPHFRTKLSAGSRKVYGINLRRLKGLLPTAPAQSIERSHITRLIDKMADTPGAANSFLSTVAALYKWGRLRGHVTANPTQDIDPLDVGEHDPWPQHVLEAALAAKDDRVRLATHLLYYTAQRIGDVCKMRWGDVRDGHIHVVIQKTKKVMLIPLHEKLAAELARTPKAGMTILVGPDGKQPKQDLVRSYLQDFAEKMGVKVVPHGLRKNAINILLESGCSAAEAASISGQSLQMIEHYAKMRAQPKLASAALIKWQRNAS